MESIFSINQDSFIYAVRQAFDARTRPHGAFNSHLKYTPFLENTWEKPSESSISTLGQPLNEILKHHWNAIPQYQRREKVNLENIAWFAHSIATLFADIEHLLKSVLGHGLPQKNAESTELWALITTSVQNVFHEYAELFNAYADWKFNPPIEKKETIDWNVRPPCGLLYKTEFKALFDEIRNARFGNKFSKPQGRRSTDPKAQAAKPLSTDHPPYQDKRRERDKPERKHLQIDQTALLQPALEECKKAIETLKNNDNIHEISLSPQNSFVRRHQHTTITDAGFDTDSRGEGAYRHVCIIRKQQ